VTDDGQAPPGGRAPELDLRVGSLVVYGGHGVARVVRTEDGVQAADPGRSVVLEFASGLSVTLPIERAVTCLRPLAGEVELAQVRGILRSKEAATETSWHARTKDTRTKLAAGETVGLAEVVRDSAHRDGRTLSSHERDLYLKARRLLAAELAAATESDESQANAWIDAELNAVAAR